MENPGSMVFTARFGQVAGWCTFALVVCFSIVGPMIVAGQRVSGTLDDQAIRAYFSHDGLSSVSAGGFLIIFALIPFVFALRQILSIDERSRFFATTGLLFAVAAVPLYLASNTLQVTLVTVAQRGSDVVPTFRFWDVLYNSAAYVTEAGYTASFALAMRGNASFPRWMPVYGLIVGILQFVNVTALFVGIPDNATIVGNLAFMGWFVGSSIGLGRAARNPSLS